jgi:4-hydroxythreonine-4-phosphate dehydrogenase
MKIRIAVSIGDVNGIGPEIVLKTLSSLDATLCTTIIAAPHAVIKDQFQFYTGDRAFHYVAKATDVKENAINILSIDSETDTLEIGKQSGLSGKIAMCSIDACLQLIENGDAHALVTAPISKEAVNKAGYFIPGHTEYLAEKTGVDSVLMMLVNGGLRVALATVHVPISKVSHLITKELLEEKLQLLNLSLKYDFGISSPKIAILGLNPHAGDGGVIGKEELEIMQPAIEKINHSGIEVHGPFPADGFFGQKSYLAYDAVLAMYHDQGLAPFKLLSFGSGVNFSAGLPIIRTSPDHGTAFDIAGKNLADPSSFMQAYQLAQELAWKKYGN